jgi:hypothetical protein
MSEKKRTNRSEYVASTDVDRSLVPPSHDDIAHLAHALWEDRGGGDGRAEFLEPFTWPRPRLPFTLGQRLVV